jgi:hypothetical protein
MAQTAPKIFQGVPAPATAVAQLLSQEAPCNEPQAIAPTRTWLRDLHQLAAKKIYAELKSMEFRLQAVRLLSLSVSLRVHPRSNLQELHVLAGEKLFILGLRRIPSPRWGEGHG